MRLPTSIRPELDLNRNANTVPPRTIILHSVHDATVSIEASFELLQNSLQTYTTEQQPVLAAIESRLSAHAYKTRVSSHPMYDRCMNVARLLPIGLDHRLNEPDPQDPINRNPHPLHAMTNAIEILANSAPENCPAILR